MNIIKELNTVKELVLSVMQENWETRNNDTLLYIECCKKIGAKTIEDMEKINLSIISVHKIRQVIQNKDMMCLPIDKVKRARNNRQVKIKEYMSRVQIAEEAWIN